MRTKRHPISGSVIESTPPREATRAEVNGSALFIVSTAGAEDREKLIFVKTKPELKHKPQNIKFLSSNILNLLFFIAAEGLSII